MIYNPLKPTRDFLDSLITVKAPTVFLPGSRDENHYFSSSNNIRHVSSQDRQNFLLKILGLSAVPVPPPLTTIYEQLEVTRNKGASLVKEAVNTGYALVHQFHPSRRGGYIKILQNTDLGWSALEQVGFPIQRPEQVLGGGWNHNLQGIVMGRLGKRKHYKVSYEVIIGPQKKQRMDLILEVGNGERTYCQCCYSSPEREAHNAIKALSTPPVTSGRLLLICRDKTFINRLSAILKKEGIILNEQKRFSMKVFGDILEQYYKKSEPDFI